MAVCYCFDEFYNYGYEPCSHNLSTSRNIPLRLKQSHVLDRESEQYTLLNTPVETRSAPIAQK